MKYETRGKIFVAGDLNSRTGNSIKDNDVLEYDRYIDNFEQDEITNISITKRVSMDHVIDRNGRRLLDLCKSVGLHIANGRMGKDKSVGQFTFCTKNGRSVVDYLLLNYVNMTHVKAFEVLPFNEFSDHAPITFSLHTKHVQRDNSAQTRYTCTHSEKLVWNKDRVSDFIKCMNEKAHVMQNLIDKLQVESPIDEITAEFSDFMYQNAFTFFGKVSTKRTNRKKIDKGSNWFNDACKQAKSEFTTARNRYRRNGDRENRVVFVNARTKYNRVKKKAQNCYRSSHGKSLSKLAKENPRQFWKSLKSCYNITIKPSSNVSAKDFYTHFKDILNKGKEPNETENDTDTNIINDPELDAEFSEDDIRKGISKLNNNKSAGLDGVIAEVFKSSENIITPFLTTLFNKIFISGNYPKKWGEGCIIPLYKKGDIDDVNNYRGITLINIVAKLYSQLIHDRLMKWAIKCKKLSQHQFGFQKGKSTTDCIFTFSSIITKILSSGNKVYCAFIDYEKAFDTVNRSLLWKKLIREKMSSRMIQAIKSMYETIKCCIKYSNEYSDFLDSHIGLKQGCPLSSLMFMFFINDITDSIDTSNLDGTFTMHDVNMFLLLYADDTAIFAKTKESLQSMLNDLKRYCDQWRLKVNTGKTKVMVFEKGRHTRPDLYFGNTLLEVVESFKYLGVVFYKNCHWNRMQKRLADHGSFALHKLYVLMDKVNLPVSELCKLFEVLVEPVISYSAEVWGYNEAKDIESLHLKFCRKILGVKKSTNISGLYGELGRTPLSVKRKFTMLKYWAHLLNDRNTMVYKAYLMLKNDLEQNITYNRLNWSFQIKSILDELGLSYVWIHQDDIVIPLGLIKERLKDHYLQLWRASLESSSRLDHYKIYKHTFEFEQYLDNLQDTKQRNCITKLRLSSHHLEIELGRYDGTPKQLRKCRLCSLNAIESEFHFLLVCPCYSIIRRKYFSTYYCHWPTLQKFKSVMSLNNTKHLIQLSKFIIDATKIREHLLSEHLK